MGDLMFLATVFVSVLLALAVFGSAVAKLTKNPKILENLASLKIPAGWLPRLATAEIAGGTGVLVGLAVPLIGIAAAGGLIGYFVGAVIAHLRAQDKEIAPAAVLGLVAVAALVLRVTTV
jgi:DoxX-like family